MEIDSKLIKFKNDVGSKLSSASSGASSFSEDLNSMSSSFSSFSSSLSSTFKSSSSKEIEGNVAFIEKVISDISSSISSELSNAISKCSDLNSKIGDLEKILSEYNSLSSQCNSCTDETRKASLINSTNSKKSEFDSSQTACLSLYTAIMSMDSSVEILKSYGTVDAVSSATTEINLNPNIDFSSIFYEKDGIVYQKVIPISNKDGVSYTMDENYIIVYNKEKILQNAESAGSREVGENVIKWLNERMAGGGREYCYDNATQKYNEKTKAAMIKVFDGILDDSYKAMNCKSIADYATVAGTVLSNSFVHVKYGGCGNKVWEKGSVGPVGSCVECNGFIRWCYSQGAYNYYADRGITIGPKNVGANGDATTPYSFFHNKKSYDLKNLTEEQLREIPVGSVLSTYCTNNLHVGMVIGHTRVNGEEALIVAQSGGTYGVDARPYTLTEIKKNNNSGKSWERCTALEDTSQLFSVCG